MVILKKWTDNGKGWKLHWLLENFTLCKFGYIDREGKKIFILEKSTSPVLYSCDTHQNFLTVFLAMRMNVFMSYQSYAHVEASPSACLFETMFDGMVASLLPVFLSTSLIFSIVFLF